MLSSEVLRSFLLSQLLVWGPLLLGHRLRKQGWLSEGLARPLHAFNLILITPVVIGMGVWLLDRSAKDWIWVPIVMTGMVLVSTVLAVWLSPRLARGNRPQAGTLSVLIPLSNVGHTLAGPLVLLLLPTQAFSYASIWMWPQVIFIFLVWMPIASHYGQSGGKSFARTFRETVFSPNASSLIGLLAGTALNAAGMPMSAGLKTLLQWLVFAGTALAMFAMGLRLRFRMITGFQRLLSWVYLVKFIVHPLVTVALCLALGVSGMPAGALLIGAVMPAGVYVVVLSTLFNLDVDLANSGFIWTTIVFMLVVLPILILALQAPLFH